MRREVEGARCVEVCDPGEDDPGDGSEDAEPEQLRKPADYLNAAIEQEHAEQAGGDGEKSGGRYQQADFERANGRAEGAREIRVLQRMPQVRGIPRRARYILMRWKVAR